MGRLVQGPYIPKLAILGNGRAGKDTCGAWLGTHTLLRYVGSTSQVICPLIAKELGISEQEAWDTRHQNRKFWYDFANKYRIDDPTKLAKHCLKTGDMVVGLRDKVELQACKDAGLFDLIIWVERDTAVADPTVTFCRSDCDIIVENSGSFDELYHRLARLVSFAGLQVK